MVNAKFFVYILQSLVDNNHYTGYTENLEKRIKRHNEGYVRSTRKRKPFKLIYFEEFNTKKEAQDRERYLKSGWGRKYLKAKLQKMAR